MSNEKKLILPLPGDIQEEWSLRRDTDDIIRDVYSYPGKVPLTDAAFRGRHLDPHVGYIWSRFDYVSDQGTDDVFSVGYRTSLPSSYLLQDRFPVLTVGPEMTMRGMAHMFGDSEEFSTSPIPNLIARVPFLDVVWGADINPYYGHLNLTILHNPGRSAPLDGFRILYLTRPQLERWMTIHQAVPEFTSIGFFKANALMNIGQSWPIAKVNVLLTRFSRPYAAEISEESTYLSSSYLPSGYPERGSFSLLNDLLKRKAGVMPNTLVASLIESPAYRASVQAEVPFAGTFNDPSKHDPDLYIDLIDTPPHRVVDIAFSIKNHTTLL